MPCTSISLDAVNSVERFLGLEDCELTDLLPRDARLYARNKSHFTYSEMHRLSWHLPDDFHKRTKAEKQEILDWINGNTRHRQTEYRRYLAKVRAHHFSLRFPDTPVNYRRNGVSVQSRQSALVIDAPQRLQEEMKALLSFRMSDLVPVGLVRNGKWREATAAHHVANFGRFFGSLASDPSSVSGGAGVPVHALTFALCLSPAVCDWFLKWREKRRGFYTTSEFGFLVGLKGLVQPGHGWLRQMPWLADHLVSVDGFVSDQDIIEVRADWDGACDRMLNHIKGRSRDVARVMRNHRDPAEPIISVLDAEDPAAVYRLIEDEILRWRPSERGDPMGAAETTRDFLLLHIALKSGLRQRNLREMRFASPDMTPTPERHLMVQQRGELRWNNKAASWEIFMPVTAFKNAHSRFFSGQSIVIDLGNSGSFGERMTLWSRRHRTRLIGKSADPGTMFVSRGRRPDDDVSMSIASMTHHWYRIIRKYGIYNPYTKRGAVPGLLPHGPHNVRDVRVTHVLKATGSFEIASYAIHDTAQTVEKHYGRFLPAEKARRASDILNVIWSNETVTRKRQRQ